MNNDLISRETLKKEVIGLLTKWADGYCYIEIPTEDALTAMEHVIDNAPAVEVPEKAEDYTSIVCGECILGDCDSCEDLRGDME